MRKGFTLIELMIVIAIIAIIAAIAIPNLLESRITSNESAAASSLKAGLLPAQTQFQGGNYCDDPTGIYGLPSNGAAAALPIGAGGNGIGDFAGTFNQMCGGDVDDAGASTVTLTLLPPTWGENGAVNPVVGGAPAFAAPALGGVGLGPNINNYIFTVLAANEIGWASMATPSDGADSIGRRRFAINSGGTVYATAASPTNAEILLTDAVQSPFGANVAGALVPGTAPFNTPTGAQPLDSLGGPWAVHKK